ncbi:MAG: T9SS type A sorting domain-containing protein [Chitinophagales bacterium]|nr:T9SS type A sorting domain-containing protein [Bacteroidota bacterium]
MKPIRLFFICMLCNFFFNTSIAQINWTKHSTPVLSRSAVFPDWKGLATGDAFVIHDNDTLKMWYSGVGWLTATDDCPHVRMGYAWSVDGIIWNEFAGNPVLDISADTSQFDSDGIETPTVIKDISAPVNERYKLWYAGRKASCQPINDHQIGYAYSADGISWTKYNDNPVLSPGSDVDWYNTFISGPSVILEEGIYKMWFTAPDLIFNSQPTDGKGNIGYATSLDGIHWEVFPSSVLIAGAQDNWDSASIAEPIVIKVGSKYYMFYSALNQWAIENFQIGFAESTDGINWTKSTENPVLQIGNTNEWDRYWATHPTVIYDSIANKFKMWYTGRDTAIIDSIMGYYWDIGYAESIFSTTELIENTNKNTTLHIYPNPNNGIFTLVLPDTFYEDAVVRIYNSTGELITQLSYLYNEENTLEIQLPDGLYILTLQNEKGFLKEKLIIQK